MNRLPLIGIGATFTLLLLFAPLMTSDPWSDTHLSAGAFLWLSLPIIALGLIFYRGTDWMIYWLFPVSHLPSLIIEEHFTKPTLYTGWTGALALVSIIAVGIAYLAVAQGTETRATKTKKYPQQAKVQLLQVTSALIAFATFAAFCAATVTGTSKEALSSSFSIIVGSSVVWFILNGQLWPRLGEPWLDPNVLRRAQASTFVTKRPSAREIWTTCILIVFSLLGILIWIAARGLE